MKFGANLLAGLINSIWSALVGFAIVPFYLKYLGIEAYGLIGFFVTIQAVLGFLDMGMAPTINREVARCYAVGQLHEAGKLLHTLAVVYWVVAGLIVILMVLLAPMIAGYWLKSKLLTTENTFNALILMGVVIACRWPASLYQAALIGAARVKVSSGINIAATTFGGLGAVAVLAFISPTIEAFFAWQAFVGLLYAVAMRAAAWKIISRKEHLQFNLNTLKFVWKFTAQMGGVGLTALLITQVDKVVLSKTLSLDAFGTYMLASVVVGGLNVFIIPLFNVVYPRFSSLVAGGQFEELLQLYKLGTRAFASVIFPVAITLVVFAERIVFFWTGNAVVAASAAPVIGMLATATALHGMMYFPYSLQLAFGMAKLALITNIILAVVLIPLVVILSQEYGANGGAMALLAFHILYVVIGVWAMHVYVLKDAGISWLFDDVSIPLIISMITGGVLHILIQMINPPVFLELIVMGLFLVALIATLMVYFVLPVDVDHHIRLRIRKILQERFI